MIECSERPLPHISEPRITWSGAYPGLLDTFARARSRYLFQVADAVLTAKASPFPGSEASLINAGTRSYRRARTAVNLLARILPSAVERARRKLFRPVQLPLRADTVTPLSFGAGVTVFLLERRLPQSHSDRKVLKVYRRSVGRRPEVLLQLARDRQMSYEALRARYAGCSALLPTYFMVVNGPLLGRPVLACVQPYVDGPYTDLFGDLSEDQLVALLEGHARLRSQFALFTDRTLRAAAAEHTCVDLLGRNNLIVTGGGEELRMVLLDINGVFDFKRKLREAPESLAQIKDRLGYLRRVRDRVTY
jgi:hypothetical protein